MPMPGLYLLELLSAYPPALLLVGQVHGVVPRVAVFVHRPKHPHKAETLQVGKQTLLWQGLYPAHLLIAAGGRRR